MNFKPEKLLLGKGPNGKKFRIEQWNYDTRAGVELLSGFVNFYTSVLFAELMSPFMALITILSFNGKTNMFNLIGLGIGSYFLYDAYNGWLVTSFIRILLSDNMMNWLICLNAIAVLIHAVLFLFGPGLFKLITNTCSTYEKCNEMLYLIMIGLVVFGWLFTSQILESHPGWCKKNIEACIERNKDPEPEPEKWDETQYNDGYFHYDPNHDKRQDEFYNGKEENK
jgi:hypothetical protein